MDEILSQCSPLFASFTFWYHNPNDNNWSIDNYNEIINFNHIEEFWQIMEMIKPKLFESGMFFLMKENIQPTWEDEANLPGGCISFKIEKQNVYQIWEQMLVHLISNNLPDNVNGISISPKKNFNIIKIWISEQVQIEDFKLPNTLQLGNIPILFRSHEYNIEKDKIKNSNE